MAERAITGFDRRCRVCHLWTYHEGEEFDAAATCGHCGATYGHLVLGDDVPRRKNPAPKLTKTERAAIKAAKLAKAPAKGEYGHRGRAR